LPETAEVDHAPYALAQSRARERLGAGELAGRKVSACSSAHGVDQVVGDVHVAADPIEGRGAEDVGLVKLETALLEVACARSVAHHAADGPAVVGECGREPAADVAGGAGHERTPSRGGSWAARGGHRFECVMSRRGWHAVCVAQVARRGEPRRAT
jgi:hypothetical protein